MYHSCQARAICLLREWGQGNRRCSCSWSADGVSGAAHLACCPLQTQSLWIFSVGIIHFRTFMNNINSGFIFTSFRSKFAKLFLKGFYNGISPSRQIASICPGFVSFCCSCNPFTNGINLNWFQLRINSFNVNWTWSIFAAAARPSPMHSPLVHFTPQPGQFWPCEVALLFLL